MTLADQTFSGQNRKPGETSAIWDLCPRVNRDSGDVIRHLSKKMCIATRGGFGITRHSLHEWKRLGVGRNSKLGPFCLEQGVSLVGG